MRRKHLAIALLIAAGPGIAQAVANTPPPVTESKADAGPWRPPHEQMSQLLGVRPDQAARFDEVTREQRAEHCRLREAHRAEMQKVDRTARERLGSVLDPEQLARYDALDGLMKAHRPGPPPAPGFGPAGAPPRAEQ